MSYSLRYARTKLVLYFLCAVKRFAYSISEAQAITGTGVDPLDGGTK